MIYKVQKHLEEKTIIIITWDWDKTINHNLHKQLLPKDEHDI